MIRIAFFGASETGRQELAARLRGVALMTPAPDDAASIDAAVFSGVDAADARIERFLQAGKPLLLAIHRGLTLERMQALNRRAGEFGVTLAIVNPERYLPSRQRIRQLLDAGKLGEPGLIRLHRWKAGGDMAPGALLCDLDLVLWYFGTTPNLVYASSNQGAMLIHLGFSGGGAALLDYAQCLPAGDGYESLSIIGSAGALTADDHPNRQLVFQGGLTRTIAGDEGVMASAALVQEFADRFVGQDANPAERRTGSDSCPTAAWRDVFRVVEAVRTSLQIKQAVAPERLG